MASLIELVDQVIGDLLQKNVFTDTNTYAKNIIEPRIPSDAHRHIPNTDPQPLDLSPPRGFEHPHKELAKPGDMQVMPADPMHDNLPQYTNENGLIPGPKRSQIYQGTPPGEIPLSVNQQAQKAAEKISQPQSRGEIYGPRGTPPPSVSDQTERQRKTISQPQSRGEIYGPNGPVPDSIEKQRQTIQGNSLPSKNTPSPQLGVPFTNDQGQVLRDKSNEFYDSPRVAPLSQLDSLINFHEQKTRPPTPTFTAETNSQDATFPPKTPQDNPPPNDFIGVEPRPLNFRDGDDFQGETRNKLAAGFHEQKVGSNAELNFAGQIPEPHGLIENNRFHNQEEIATYKGFTGPAPKELNYFNIITSAYWLRNIATELGVPSDWPNEVEGYKTGEVIPERLIKGVSFFANQFLLTSFNVANPENGVGNAIYNPLSLLAAVPAVSGLGAIGDATNFTVGSAIGGYGQGALDAEAIGTPRLLNARKGVYSEVSPIHRASKLYTPIAPPGFLGSISGPGPSDTLDDNQKGNITSQPLLSPMAQVDGGTLGETAIKQGASTNIYNADRPYNPENAAFPLEKVAEASVAGKDPASAKVSNLFDYFIRGDNSVFSNVELSSDLTGGPKSALLADWKARSRLAETDGFSQGTLQDAPGLNAAVVDAGFPFEEDDGTLTGDPFAGDELYMDLMFQDLRDPEDTFLYFRAFLKGDINETFTPDWQTNRYYGRVDQVPIYQGTNRTLNFTFDVAAFKPGDLPVVWRKLTKLQSLVYPTFDTRGFLNQGPLIRLRIGDLFAGENNKGLPGFISGMDWSFPDGIWNIEKNLKVPRLITVAISYTVIHDGNPGTYLLEQWDVNEEGDVSYDSGGRTFGSARISENAEGYTTFKVSAAEVRKIFAQVKNKA